VGRGSERSASGFDAGYYGKLQERTWEETALCSGRWRRSAGQSSIKLQDEATIAERSDDLNGGPNDSIINGLQLFRYNKKFSFIDIIIVP
jgi:hypothetical protein